MPDQLMLLERLGVFTVRDFIDIRLCRQLLAEIRRLEAAKIFRPGKLSRGKEEVLDESYRKVLETTDPVPEIGKAVMQTLTDKLIAIKPQLEAKFEVELVDYKGPQLMYYKEGSFCSPHVDRNYREDTRDDIKRRRVSTVLFINGERQTGKADDAERDTYEGGELVFYDLLSREEAVAAGLSLSGQPRLYVTFERAQRVIRYGLSLHGQPGLLVAFDSRVLHEVKPVTAGDRLTLITWFLGE